MNSETQVAEVADNAEEAAATESVIFHECDPSDQCLFYGKDEVGREGWFLP